MTQPVSQKTEDALRVAMKRLLDGTSVHTDGRLNVANLAREADERRLAAGDYAFVRQALGPCERRITQG